MAYRNLIDPNGTEFATLCRELLGPDWDRCLPGLSGIVGVNPRTLQRIARGEHAAPDALLDRIRELVPIARRNRAAAAKAAAAERARRKATGS
jgi:hypothetical protein